MKHNTGKQIKRISAVVLTLTMLLGIVCVAPFTVSAAGNNRSTATSYTMGNKVNGNISRSNLIDYYKFTLSSSGTLKLDLNSYFASSRMKLYEAANNLVWDASKSWNSSSKSLSYTENITVTSGTYYFVIEGLDLGSDYYGSYNFKFTFTSANESFKEVQGGSNNTFDKASNVNLNTKYKAQIAYNDKIDYYKFTLATSGTITINYNSEFDYNYITIYDSSRSKVCSEYEYWNSSSKSTAYTGKIILTSGTYFLEIKGIDSSESYHYGKYDFKLDYASAGETFKETQNGSNNTFDKASRVNFNKKYNAQLAYNDLIDYYKFSLSSSGTVTLKYNSFFYSNYITLYDASRNQVWTTYESWNRSSKSTAYTVNLTLTSGTYYLEFKGNSYLNSENFGKYDFQMSFSSSNETFKEVQGGSNNTFSKASSINLNTVYNAQIALNDKIDYYKFYVSGSSKVTFNYTSNFDGNYFAIYDSSQSQVWTRSAYKSYSDNSVSFNDSITLTSGTYYLEIKGGRDGKYNFSLSKTLPAPTSVKLNRGTLGLGVGENYGLVKTVSPSNANQAVSWTSSNTSVATVDSNGKVVGRRAGTATVTVRTSNGKTASCTVTVKAAPTSVKTNPASLTLGSGETYTISESTSSGSYANAANLRWSSSNNSVVTVSKQNGTNKATLRATGTGTAYVTIKTYNGLTASCKVTVKPAPSSVSTNPANLTLGNGESYTISENTNAGTYANAANLSWSSSNTRVATVTKGRGNKAVVKATGKGTAYITIRLYNGQTASCKVTVKDAPKTVSVTKTSLTLNKGQTYTIAENTNAGSYANAANLKWSSSNSNVATVTKGSGNKAVIKAVNKGTANITIRLYNGKTATCKVTVK